MSEGLRCSPVGQGSDITYPLAEVQLSELSCDDPRLTPYEACFKRCEEAKTDYKQARGNEMSKQMNYSGYGKMPNCNQECSLDPKYVFEVKP